MKRTRLVALFALAALAAPCFAQIALTGAGATFPNPIYSKWFYEYQKMHKEIQINYQALGSGAGIRQVTEGTVDFGATDGPMNEEQMKAFEEKRHTNILHFPTVLGSDVPVYNLRGISNLNFTGELLADIFLGKVTKWDDPAIARINAGVKLPKADIIVVHRAESSGTTYVWTDFLSKASPLWLSKVGRAQAVNWPVGLAGKGNDGVTGEIRQTPNSLGYVELNYAIQNHIAYGAVRNKSGKFIKADLASTTAAAAGVSMPEDFRISITDAAGANAYPISTFTWLLIPEKIQDPKKLAVIREFLQWMLGPGQKMTEALDYAPLPQSVVAKELKAISKVH